MLTFVRRTDAETILVVANMAATARAATVTLPRWAGATTRDVFGGAQFPDVRPDGTLTFTLGSREFYWLELTAP